MSRRALRWTRRALRALDRIVTRISVDSPAAAAGVVARIVSGIDILREFPSSGRAGRIATTRELVFADVPYIVAYRVNANEIEVLTILHAARRWPDSP